MKPGQVFDYCNVLFIMLACSSNNKSIKPIEKEEGSKEIDIIREQYRWMLCNHSNQSIDAEVFFRFCIYNVDTIPYDIEKDIVLQNDDHSSRLNLILNAKFDDKIYLFLMKEPIYVKEQMHGKLAIHCKYETISISIKKAFNALFTGYIKKVEREGNINIPVVILSVIKDYIVVGPALFYCKGFKNPLYGTDIYFRYISDMIYYESS